MEESKVKRRINPLTEEKNENERHLNDKLVREFSPPLLIAVLGAIVIYLICSIVFTINIIHNSQIKNSFFKLNLQLHEQLILQVENVLMYKTQSIFDLLRKIESTAKFFNELYDNNTCKDKIKEYINEYTLNINDINENTTLDKNRAVFGKNENTSMNIDINSKNVKKVLYTFSALIPMLSSMYNSTNINEENIENIFMIMNKYEIYLDFPLTNDTVFKTGKNRAFCFNELNGQPDGKIVIPERYDYHCQSWFSDSLNLNKLSNKSFYISPPYYITKSFKILVTTICLNSTEIKSETDINEEGDYYLFCINVRFKPLLDMLELINHKIHGYYFVTRVFNQKAFYYPKTISNRNDTQTYFFDNFNLEEFNLHENYYLDELNEYINQKNSFLNIYENYDSNSLLETDYELKGEFMKNDKKYYYYIVPVFNHLSNATINLLNIIYIYADETTENTISNIGSKLINAKTLTFLLILFLVQALIVMTLVNHLIRAIAFNIILPMKNIKKIFEKFNYEDEDLDNEDNLLLTNNNFSNNNIGSREIEKFEERKSHRIKSQSINRSKLSNFGLSRRSLSKKIFTKNNEITSSPKTVKKLNKNADFIGHIDDKDDFLNNYEDIGSDSDNNENYINIKSKDIQDLFSRMINVKKSLDTINSNDQNDVKKLPDILFASEVFGEIKNERAKNICVSNIANIFLKLKKYDLAIIHLIESEILLEKEINNDLKNNETDPLNINNIQLQQTKKKLPKRNSFIFSGLSANEINLNKDKIGQKVLEKNKILIESRYPKLIYCYKKFFKNIKKLNEMKLSREITKNRIDDYEYYISKNFHMLNNFREYIEKYVELCQLEVNYVNSKNRLIQALLEKIEFIIKYEINEENFNVENIEENLDLLYELMKKVKKLIKNNKEIIKPKNILKILLNGDFNSDLDEIPNCILLQRLNYNKGKLALKCGHYMEAIKKFQKVFMKSSDKITDIKIIVKSYKKLIKIAELMNTNVNILIKKPKKIF